jgi:hypothetical protein
MYLPVAYKSKQIIGKKKRKSRKIFTPSLFLLEYKNMHYIIGIDESGRGPLA